MEAALDLPWPMDDDPPPPRRTPRKGARVRADEQMRNALRLDLPHALEKALEISPMRAAQLRIRSSYALVYRMVSIKSFILMFVTLHEDGRQEMRTNQRYTWEELRLTLSRARTPLPVERPIWRAVHKLAMDPFACPEVAHVA